MALTVLVRNGRERRETSDMSPLKNSGPDSGKGRKGGTVKPGKIRYYIGKKQYVPQESGLLCASENDNFGNPATRKLYRTGKGSYFLVSESRENETKVQLMDEKQAFDFMDEHTACIDTDTYDRIFGIPEKG